MVSFLQGVVTSFPTRSCLSKLISIQFHSLLTNFVTILVYNFQKNYIIKMNMTGFLKKPIQQF